MIKILVVDDESDIRILLPLSIRKCTEASVMIETAGSLKEAREVLEKFKPDIVFLDVNLPDGLGIVLRPEILGKNKNARINIISAKDDKWLAERLGEDELENTYSKPITREKVCEILKKQII